jgi:hypothetical protein
VPTIRHQQERIAKIKQYLAEVRVLEEKIEANLHDVIMMDVEENPEYKAQHEALHYQYLGMQEERSILLRRIGDNLNSIHDDGFFAGIELHGEQQLTPLQQVYQYWYGIPIEELNTDFQDVSNAAESVERLRNYTYNYSAMSDEVLDNISLQQWGEIAINLWIEIAGYREEQP